MAWQCTQWSALPEAGGLLDQPAGLIKKMSAALNTYNIFYSRLHTKDLIGWLDADRARHDYYVAVRGMLNDGN